MKRKDLFWLTVLEIPVHVALGPVERNGESKWCSKTPLPIVRKTRGRSDFGPIITFNSMPSTP
jgi:hypothetical protein